MENGQNRTTMNPIAKLFIILGAGLIVVGLLWQAGSSLFNLGRLPGDIAVERDNVRIYFPIVTCIILSVVLSLIVTLIRWFNR